MNSRILWRLIAYFSAALLLFSLFVGFSFVWIFGQYNTESHREVMVAQAKAIASSATPVMCGDITSLSGNAAMDSHHMEDAQAGGMGRMGMGQGRGYGSFIRSVQLVSMADVWLVNREDGLVTRGHANNNFVSSELPADAELIITKAFDGEIAFSESFNDWLEQPAITVAAPVFDEEQNIIGAVLLHSPIEGVAQAQKKGIQILSISMGLALILAIFAAVLLSLRFTRPLKTMKSNALLLADGDYKVRNQISQKDEIGELASTMDLLAEKLALAKEETVKTETLRRDFISNVSHELRTPVTVMRGSLEALCDKVVTQPEKVEEYHKQLLAESLHMQRLVNDLLELSRLQNDGFEMEMQRLSLNDVVADAARSSAAIAQKKNIFLHTTQPDYPFMMQGDYGRIRQMFLAVLDNAIKFSSENGKVEITQVISDNVCTVSITDFGCGIPKDDLPNIFGRFYSVHTTQNKSGTGLGLSIANEIAKRHGAKIEVESNPQHTIFSFLFNTN